MPEQDIDLRLVKRVQEGDKKAFDLLVLKYQRKVMSIIARLVRQPAEIEDIAQETFIKVYRAIPNFKGESASTPGFIASLSIVRTLMLRKI